MKRKGLPRRNELVVCRIVRLNPNSAYAELLEYDASGMIHVSEVARRWVRDIREFVKENQYVVCSVVSADETGIALSMKRVHPQEAERQLNRFKRESKAEKILEFAAKTMGKTLDQAYEEVGHRLVDAFGSMQKAFEIALRDPDVLKKHVPAKWYSVLVEVAQKRAVEKTYTVKAELNMASYEPDGVERIKRALSLAGKGMNVSYVSAPRYVISTSGTNYKEVKRRVAEAAESITKALKGGEASFKILED
jgi:translation initiation factor 2 subunit 1